MYDAENVENAKRKTQNKQRKTNNGNRMQLNVPAGQTLLPFQHTAIEQTIHFLQNNPANACYNACEMGLGKTVQAIVAMNTLGCWKVLVICPAIMRLVWQTEIIYWSSLEAGKIDVILSGKDADDRSISNADVQYVVTSYDLASSRPFLTWLERQPWDAVIMDEAHYLKNTRAKRTHAVLDGIWKASKYRLALSGTPFTTRVVDGYTLFKRMIPKRWPDFDSFADEFSYKQMKNIGGRLITDYFGVKNADTLRTLIRENFYVRFTKDEVLSDLPPKQFTRVPLPLKYAVLPRGKTEEEQLKIEAEMIRRAIEEDKPVPVPKCLAEHRRLQGERKAEAVIEFVKDLLEQDIPVVLFAWHKNVIAAYAEAFKDYRPAIITGETPAQRRKHEVARFQERDAGDSTNLFLGNMVAAGVGITLTRSSTCVLGELDWSPTTVAQAVDRLHRIGQRDTVNVYYFTVEKSIDESLTNTVMSRARTFKTVLDGK